MTALPVARQAAAQLNAELEILHVASSEPSELDLKEQLGPAAAGLQHVAIRLIVGDPAAEILRLAADPQVALIVMTTHGRMPEFDRPLGRVAEAVVARVERPVLLVRPAAALQPQGRIPALQRLLVPLDGTPTTASGLAPVTELARQLGSSIDLLFVSGTNRDRPIERGSIGAPMYVDQPQHEWPSWSREVIHRLGTVCAGCPADVPLHMFLARDGIGDGIVRFAAEHDEDAIVLVRRSRLER